MNSVATLIERTKKKVFGYIIVRSFTLNALCLFLSELLEIQYDHGFTMLLGNSYLIYILIGYCLETWYCSWQVGYSIQRFKGYLNRVFCILPLFCWRSNLLDISDMKQVFLIDF